MQRVLYRPDFEEKKHSLSVSCVLSDENNKFLQVDMVFVKKLTGLGLDVSQYSDSNP